MTLTYMIVCLVLCSVFAGCAAYSDTRGIKSLNVQDEAKWDAYMAVSCVLAAASGIMTFTFLFVYIFEIAGRGAV